MKKAKLIDLINLVLKPEKTPGMLFISLNTGNVKAGRGRDLYVKPRWVSLPVKEPN
jgi:hypothetical protein